MNSNKIKPPALAQRILLLILKKELAEEVSGDLDEKFYAMVDARGSTRAKLNYWYQVIHYIRPFAVRKIMLTRLTIFFMFNNYTKISFRNLLRQKLYSFINIGGLAIGISAFILISLYVQHELSFDRFLKNHEQIYRIYQRQQGNEFLGSDYFSLTPAQLATILPEEFPEVEAATRINGDRALLTVNKHAYYEKGLLADDHFFDVFPFDILRGNAAKTLPDAKSIVLTKSLALKIFGHQDPLGQSVQYQNDDVFTVTAVMQDLPPTSSIQFSYLVNIRSSAWASEQLDRAKWDGNSVFTFFKLPKTSDPLDLQRKLATLHDKYRDPKMYEGYPFIDEYIVQPLADMHLQANINEDIGIKGNTTYLYLFSAVGLLILILACVNYMNLAVARSINRTKEVGVRKVMGALRSQLIAQFLGDSVFISFFALLLGLGLTYTLLPFFGQLIDRTLTLDFTDNHYLSGGLLFLTLFVGILSGSYPALVMSGHRPADIVKGKVRTSLSGFSVQKALIVAQFTVSLVLVVCSLVIYFQLQFIQQKELGYNKDHVIVIQAREYLSKQRLDALRHEWLQNKDVVAVSRSSNLLTNISSSSIINDENGNKGLSIYQYRTDYDFLDVFGIKLLAGRNFSPDVATDPDQAYLINETAAKALGWTPEEAIGKQFTHEGVETVVGVVKDFHMHSMHLAVQPLMIRLRPEDGSTISVKVSPERLGETIAFLEKSMKKQSPYPFEYQFMDEHFNDLYKTDIKLGETFKFFTLLSMIIAALGLFGLAAFMAVQRTKEIGIRKVLGASSGSIVFLLGKDFLLLVAFAFVISIPVSWYSMHLWLEGFAYRIEMEWWMFGAAGVLAFIVANITIGYQSLKASWMDPVESLRSE